MRKIASASRSLHTFKYQDNRILKMFNKLLERMNTSTLLEEQRIMYSYLVSPHIFSLDRPINIQASKNESIQPANQIKNVHIYLTRDEAVITENDVH